MSTQNSKSRGDQGAVSIQRSYQYRGQMALWQSYLYKGNPDMWKDNLMIVLSLMEIPIHQKAIFILQQGLVCKLADYLPGESNLSTQHCVFQSLLLWLCPTISTLYCYSLVYVFWDSRVTEAWWKSVIDGSNIAFTSNSFQIKLIFYHLQVKGFLFLALFIPFSLKISTMTEKSSLRKIT